MTFSSILLTLLLLAPPIVIACFWRVSLERHKHGMAGLPDAEALILARVGGVLCAVLAPLQLLAGVVRYRTGEAGLYLWYLVAGAGLLLAVMALAAFLTHARGWERKVSAGMVLLSLSMLLLITLLDSPFSI